MSIKMRMGICQRERDNNSTKEHWRLCQHIFPLSVNDMLAQTNDMDLKNT